MGSWWKRAKHKDACALRQEWRKGMRLGGLHRNMFHGEDRKFLWLMAGLKTLSFGLRGQKTILTPSKIHCLWVDVFHMAYCTEKHAMKKRDTETDTIHTITMGGGSVPVCIPSYTSLIM